VNKIQPYLFSKTFECAYYIWTGSNTIEGHLVHGVWTSAMQNKITISYRDASLSMLVNNKPTVIDYYYEKINSHSPDSTDLTALQQLPNMPVGAFFSKVIMPIHNENGVWIYNVKILAITTGTTLWTLKPSPHPNLNPETLFMYNDNTVNNITLFIDAKQNTPIYVRRLLLQDYGYPNQWIKR